MSIFMTFSSNAYCNIVCDFHWIDRKLCNFIINSTCNAPINAADKIRINPNMVLLLSPESSVDGFRIALEPTNTIDTTFQQMPTHMYVLSLSPRKNS